MLGTQGKARGQDPGFLITKQMEVIYMLTVWLNVVTLLVTIRMKLTLRKSR